MDEDSTSFEPTPSQTGPLQAGPFQALIRLVAVCWTAWGLFAAGAAGASPHGSLVGEVLEQDGSRQADVRVVLRGDEISVEKAADADGRFRFPRLAPGTYVLEVLRGEELIARYEPVAVRMGRPTTLRVELRADPEATLVVTSEPPEPAVVPTSEPAFDAADVGLLAADRDPFRAVQSAGVETVRSHSLASSDDGAGEETWRYDGVEMSAAPASGLPGGVRVRVLSSADASRADAGSVIDLVTPRRSAERRSELRLDFADRSWHGGSRAGSDAVAETASVTETVTETETAAEAGHEPAELERLTGLAGAGLEAGVELVAERLWGWGSWQSQEVTRSAALDRSGAHRGAALETVTQTRHLAVKLDAQPWRFLAAGMAHHDSERSFDGEGAARDRSLEATRLELAPSRWTSVYAGLVAGPDLAFELRFAEARDAASFLPTGSNGGIVLDAAGVWRGGFSEMHRREDRDQLTLTGDAHRDLGWVHHRVRFGYETRESTSLDSERWGDDNLQLLAGENFGSPFDLVRVRRSGTSEVTRRLDGAWVQDSLLFGRLTLDLGLRLDRQSGRARGGLAAAHALLPDLLPEVAYDGRGSRISWQDISPRLGLAWAFGRDRDTVLRLTRSTFASRLDEDLIHGIDPVAGGELLLALDAEGVGTSGDASQDGDEDVPELVERLSRERLIQSQNVDPADPTGVASGFGPNLRAERVDELTVALVHHVGATELGLSWGERLASGLLERRLLVRDLAGEHAGKVRPALAHDYRLDHVESGLLPDGSPYAVPVYGLRDGTVYTGGSQIASGDRTLKRQHWTASFHHRLRRGFQARGHLTFTEWNWRLGSKFRLFDDPTDEASGIDEAGVYRVDEAGAGEPGTAGARSAGRWSFDATALYQVARNRPWTFDVGVSVHGREGYRLDYELDVVAGDRLRQVAVSSESLRVDDLLTVDLRLQKEVRLGGVLGGLVGGAFAGTGAVLAVDVLNLFGQSAVLERELSLRAPGSGEALRAVSPRVFQIGLRLALP